MLSMYFISNDFNDSEKQQLYNVRVQVNVVSACYIFQSSFGVEGLTLNKRRYKRSWPRKSRCKETPNSMNYKETAI